MMRKGKTDELLTRIAKAARVSYLSDLRDTCSVKLLFSIFFGFRADEYTIDEWKAVFAYLFSFSGQKGVPLLDREILLWDIGQYSPSITEAIKEYFAATGLSSSFHHVSPRYEPQLNRDQKYLIFYRSSDAESEAEVRAYAKRAHLEAEFAAICASYQEGMTSMQHGDCYALQLPLRPDKVVRCMEHLEYT